MVIPVIDKPQRSDARPQPGAVLAAGGGGVLRAGLKVPIEAIAKRAGVGVGTVCRHFPTKQALIEAVLEAMYESLLADAEHGARAATTPAPRSSRSSTRSPNSRPATVRSPSRWRPTIDLPASAQSLRATRCARRSPSSSRTRKRRARSVPTSARPTSRCCSPASRTRPRSPGDLAAGAPPALPARSSSTACARRRVASSPASRSTSPQLDA